MSSISRSGSTKPAKATAFTALVASIVLLVGLALTQGPVSGSEAAAASTPSKCQIMVTGAHWRIRGSGFGTKYLVTAKGMSCSSARAWVVKFTHRKSHGLGSALKGPTGFNCQSLSEAASGDKLVYAGACRHPPHNNPYFGWAAKK
jgi:hypothetical protein